MAVTYLGTGFSQTSTSDSYRESFSRQWPGARAVEARYTMRAKDSTGAMIVWMASTVDADGVESGSSHKPLTDAVIVDER